MRLRTRLLILFTGLSLATVLAVVLLQRENHYRETRQEQEQRARAVALSVAMQRAYEQNLLDLQRLADGLAQVFPDLEEITVLDADGKTVAGKRYHENAHVWTDTVNLDHEGRSIGTVRVAFSLERADRAYAAAVAQTTLIGLALAVAGALLGLFISRGITRGIENVSAAMALVQRDDLTARVDENIGDLEVKQMARSFNTMVAGLAQAHHAFARYVSRQVAEDILSGQIPVQLSGERRRVTVLFADLREFTPLSSELPPEQVVELLNQYFALLVDAVFKQGGTIDKFIGDALMAVFNAPNAIGAHELAAVNAAVQMRAAIRQLNAKRVTAGAKPLRVGIGVHTGDVVAGNIGSPDRMDYTVIGDTVNVTQRIESATKTLFGSRRAQDVVVLCSEQVVEVTVGAAVFEPIGSFELKGKRGSRPLYLLAENVLPRVA